MTKQVLMERLCALVPRPRRHLVTYHGVLRPAAGIRPQVVPANVPTTGFWQWNMPNAPGALFCSQALAFDAAANPPGITSSNAAMGVIGF